jgi:transcriptional regulator with XRE-family HTH domain
MAKKKTTTRRKKATGSSRKSSARKARRKPTWGIVTYQELEAWRVKQGLPKKRLAEQLGVTNSTYHNWARGIAVATTKAQQRIKELITTGKISGSAAPTAAASSSEGGGTPAEAYTATAQIVNAFVQTPGGGKLSPDGLIALVREVRQALA